jgi:hypothetical protein
MSNSKFITQLINSSVLELTTIVTSNSLDGCFKLILNALTNDLKVANTSLLSTRKNAQVYLV